MAKHTCTQCFGLGLRAGRCGKPVPCGCVLRAIFRACFSRFRYCATKEKYMSRASLEFTGGREKRFTWSRKDEEYVADFCLVSRRSLSAEEYRVFKFHFLLGADWKLCCRQFRMDRGNFFHMVYRIETRLGRIFRELEPYCLYPLDEYFGTTPRRDSVNPNEPGPKVMAARVPLARRTLIPPLRKAA
ncbi:MAG: hypothetical protein M1541_19915 [Acidobacteria bacterium]|nr:hypothetical protein [Acidobacteriota bacterium]